MDSSKESKAWRWAKKGIVFGLIIAALDLTEWRGAKYIPINTGLDLLLNLGFAFGSMIGGALLFGIAGAITSLFVKDK